MTRLVLNQNKTGQTFRICTVAIATAIGLLVMNSPRAQKPSVAFSPELLMAQSLPGDRSNEDTVNYFLNTLNAGQYNAAWLALHSSLQTDWTVQRLAEIWDNARGSLGAYQGKGETRSLDDKAIAVEVRFANSTEDWIFILNDRREIIGIDFPETQWDTIRRES